MEMLKGLLFCCSAKICLTLVEADLVPQLILSLNPLSLSFEEAADIHIHLNSSIYQLLWLSTQIGLAAVRIEDRNEQQAVHETVFNKFSSLRRTEWNKTMGDQRQMGKMVHRMLRMEGIEDVIEEKLQNDKTGIYGGLIVDKSIEWNNLLGMNLPEDE
ncbi:hypothetical protein BLNAU_25075 [Blattamonas nauphoetae]|uniref:Uncharacterized protein n=1 Tax=Blattamonas nauphoetae TaxID=2049346 RepID=A0ABQ9WKM6_9EUKA|nr:hypothetical protein BLNAU_25075 [Blattamonas nauphoetae]